MSLSNSLAKVLLVVINVVILLAGLLMFALGIALAVATDKLTTYSDSHDFDLDVLDEAAGLNVKQTAMASAIFMVVVGAIITVVAVVGFCGSCCESKCFLTLYIVLITVIVLLEVSLIIFVVHFPDKLKEGREELLLKGLEKFKNDVSLEKEKISIGSLRTVDEAWMTLQVKLKCCGAKNYTDYVKYSWNRCGAECSKSVVPLSCCQLKPGVKEPKQKNDFLNFQKCVSEKHYHSAINRKTCSDAAYSKMTEVFESHKKYILGFAVVLGLLELLVLILALIMRCH